MNFNLDLPPDFSFAQTLLAHGWRQLPPFSCDDETRTLHRVELLADGRVVQITMVPVGEDRLQVALSDVANQEEITGIVRRILQLDLPIDSFHAYCASLPKLAHVPGARQGRVLTSPTLWEDVCKVIATTNTTWTQTKGMASRLCEHFGSPWSEDPTLHAFPSPEQIAGVPFEGFAEKAKLGYRAGAVHGLAENIMEGKIDLESFRDPAIPSADLWKKLLALRGVGPYAAACLMIYLGRFDKVNVDSWARMMVGKELGRKVTDKEVHDFFEPYGEWRALVYHFYPWREDPPAY
jgi:3-methyladenine DNA glycosylase/8-oxoguanine DNA glycosylase